MLVMAQNPETEYLCTDRAKAQTAVCLNWQKWKQTELLGVQNVNGKVLLLMGRRMS